MQALTQRGFTTAACSAHPFLGTLDAKASSPMGPSPPRAKMPMPLSATLRGVHRYQPDEPAARPEAVPALRHFEAATFEEAKSLACAVYFDARHCARCRRVLEERFDRLGSTLFHDDDPHELARCFEGADACTVRLFAACIVLFARNRESVH